mmetsp:Transcript_5360/g.12230  ORF Transcript_5360/g.12230 Transcript_5360/m.12230 type:complete len:368 (-) Transcript_5360:1586-2689(-)
MISNTLILSLLLVAVPASVDAFRPPENPTGIPGLKKSSLVLKKPPSTKTATPPREENNQNVISPKTIERVGKAVTADNVARGATIRKRWEIGTARVASDYEDEYWYNPTIHTFGNIGFLGGIHAALAPISTKIIDMVAYDGEDIRSVIAKRLSRMVVSGNTKAGGNPKVLDMCCGVGISTRALQDAFPDSELVVGLDTSSEMINMAGFLTNHLGFVRPLVACFGKSNKDGDEQRPRNNNKNGNPFAAAAKGKYPRRAKFTLGNAERTGFPSKTFDLVTVMYAFHEAPGAGREKILREAYRVLQPGGTLAIVDISAEYTPSKAMLAGEPYGTTGLLGLSRLVFLSCCCLLFVVCHGEHHPHQSHCALP